MGFSIGVGKRDITGPSVGVGFLGYWNFKERGVGILSRLYGRAYVIEDLDNGKIVAIVCADMMSCTQGVKKEVYIVFLIFPRRSVSAIIWTGRLTAKRRYL